MSTTHWLNIAAAALHQLSLQRALSEQESVHLERALDEQVRLGRRRRAREKAEAGWQSGWPTVG